ncbi:beta-ketoacyl reductase, partial [Kitasatospora sp. NPDC018058]|uniref:beta-ketoacyl reductase n=1 Tax=Kitasatospora sp. NPDC018058 TaxID=3364025 RepID=UPI0037C0BFFB
LVHHGARHLVLTSRRGPDTPGATELRDELQALGAHITITACDTTDRTALRTLLDHLTTTGHPVRAVFHAAGTGQTTPLTEMEVAEAADVILGKATGAALLDELLAGQDLDAFVLYSSISAAWGSTTTGAYAAANAYLDALAVHRRQRGERATSIAWGVWAGSAMVDAHTEEQLRRRGALAMAPDLAVQALDQALAHDDTNIAVAHMDWPRFATAYTAARPRPLIDSLPGVRPTTPEPVPDGPDNALRDQLAAMPIAEQYEALLHLVRTETAAELGHSTPDAVEPDRAFRDFGFDSLAAVGLRKRLDSVTGIATPVTLTFDHPTPAETARYLHNRLLDGAASQAESVLADLDRLAASLATLRAGSVERARISMRLSHLLTQWRDGADAPAALDDHVDAELDLASDEEMFDLISREFDIS